MGPPPLPRGRGEGRRGDAPRAQVARVGGSRTSSIRLAASPARIDATQLARGALDPADPTTPAGCSTADRYNAVPGAAVGPSHEPGRVLFPDDGAEGMPSWIPTRIFRTYPLFGSHRCSRWRTVRTALHEDPSEPSFGRDSLTSHTYEGSPTLHASTTCMGTAPSRGLEGAHPLPGASPGNVRWTSSDCGGNGTVEAGTGRRSSSSVAHSVPKRSAPSRAR